MNTRDGRVFEPVVEEPRSGLFRVLKFVAIGFVAATLLTAWWVKQYVYASRFTPTVLTTAEQKVLESKLTMLDPTSAASSKDIRPPLAPEPYSEKGLKREISLTEKELNALIAHDTELAPFVAVDLSENLVSVKVVVPMDEGIPILGGKTLRLNLGMTLGFEQGRPVVALKGVSIGGIPLPNAWMGNLKNRDLVKEFGGDGGFWKLFSDGVAGLQVQEGHLLIKLKE